MMEAIATQKRREKSKKAYQKIPEPEPVELHILSPKEYQQRVNTPGSEESKEILAGAEEYWIPSATPDPLPVVNGMVPKKGFSATKHYDMSHGEWKAITNKKYPFHHSINPANHRDRTLWTSGLDQVTHDNLPSKMAMVMPKIGFGPKDEQEDEDYTYLKDPRGWYLISRRTGLPLRNLGNIVPNGVTSWNSDEMRILLAVMVAYGADLKEDIYPRIHTSAKNVDEEMTDFHKALDKWHRSCGGLRPDQLNGPSKEQEDETARKVFMRIAYRPANILHRVVWEISENGQRMRLARPPQDFLVNWQGVWYPVPPAMEVSTKTPEDLEGWYEKYIDSYVEKKPSLKDYLKICPEACIVGESED